MRKKAKLLQTKRVESNNNGYQIGQFQILINVINVTIFISTIDSTANSWLKTHSTQDIVKLPLYIVDHMYEVICLKRYLLHFIYSCILSSFFA